MGFDTFLSIILNLVILCILIFLFIWANLSINNQQIKKDDIYKKLLMCNHIKI